MKNLFQNIVFQTVISGTLVFIISQLVLKFFIEPLQEFKKTVAKIDNKLKFYANTITNSGLPKELIHESSQSLRDLSCELEANYKQVILPLFVPCRKQISDAAKGLILLANSSGEQGKEINNAEEIEKIRKLLNIPAL